MSLPPSGDLAVLANRHGTDKGYLHHYIDEYKRHFAAHRDDPFRLLEIGIGGYNFPGRGGNSLRMWRDYFVAAEIHGIDIEDKSFLDGDRLKTHICSQADDAALRALWDQHGPFKIVIDDGSHQQPHVLQSFLTLFPLLPSHGIYVIEDLECAYREHSGGHPNLETPNAIGLIQRLVDGLHWQFWSGREQGPTDFDRMVKSIHVSKELVFIYKR